MSLTEVDLSISFLDFQKAFDKVPHIRLLLKLNSFEIHGNLQEWLHGREQQVVVNDCSSVWKNVTSGVPQDQFLGPYFFWHTLMISTMLLSQQSRNLLTTQSCIGK